MLTMPKKTTKKKAGKTALRKAATKAAKKTVKKKLLQKATEKKAAKKKVVKKKVVKKKVAKKKSVAAKKPAKRVAAVKVSSMPRLSKKTVVVAPGPQPTGIPPVEEPLANEEAIGVVTHYYSHIGVAVVQLNKGTLRSGGKIHVKGHSTDFFQTVESMEYEHQHIDEALAGQSVGLKVHDHAREHDIVYLVK
jgi:translation elongation factor EF-1alpha